LGAKRKRKEDVLAMVEMDEAEREVMGQERERRMSADPEDEVAALFPCYRPMR
jgi:hypothetical protein